MNLGQATDKRFKIEHLHDNLINHEGSEKLKLKLLKSKLTTRARISKLKLNLKLKRTLAILKLNRKLKLNPKLKLQLKRETKTQHKLN